MKKIFVHSNHNRVEILFFNVSIRFNALKLKSINGVRIWNYPHFLNIFIWYAWPNNLAQVVPLVKKYCYSRLFVDYACVIIVVVVLFFGLSWMQCNNAFILKPFKFNVLKKFLFFRSDIRRLKNKILKGISLFLVLKREIEEFLHHPEIKEYLFWSK